MVTWGSTPQRKVEAGAVDFSSDTLNVTVHRPENAISRASISANDYEGKNFIANIDAFTVIKVSLRYAAAGWTQVFEGITERVGPKLDSKQTVEVLAYGYGRALRNTHCSTNYGSESESPTLDTPHEIWDDLIDNMINLSFGGAATGYAITKAKIAVAANPVIPYIEGGYRNNFTLINDILTIYQGYRNGASGMHWFVDESNNLFINTIAAHENNASGWPTWWRTNQAGSTLVEGVDFTNTVFHKTLSNFANKIVLYCDLRKPGKDAWTEDGGPAWGNTDSADSYSVAQFIVGSHSLLVEPNNAPNVGFAYYPSTIDAAWDFSRFGSEKSIPHVNFYVRANNVNCFGFPIYLFTDSISVGGAADHYFWSPLAEYMTPVANKWVHISLPVGPFWALDPSLQLDTGGDEFEWNETGNPDWTDINGVAFLAGDNNGYDKFFDDFHFSGKIIREAYNSTSITANDEVQKIIRYDVAIDDTLKATDDSGTAGRLAYGELLARQAVPTVGVIVTPLAEDALPGQLIHIHSDLYSAGNWRINADFRVKEVIHNFNITGATTTWDVTSDVLNTFGIGFNNALATYHKIMNSDPEMKNIKTTGFDPYVTRLSIDYP